MFSNKKKCSLHKLVKYISTVGHKYTQIFIESLFTKLISHFLVLVFPYAFIENVKNQKIISL